MESIARKAGPRSRRAASSFPGAWRMLLLAGVSSRPRSSGSITCGAPGVLRPSGSRRGKGPGQIQLLHTACARIKLCLLFPPSMFMCNFPLLCLRGFVPLHPSAKAVPRILHGLLKVCDTHVCTRLLYIHGGQGTSISPVLETCPPLPQHMDCTKERETPPPRSLASPQ